MVHAGVDGYTRIPMYCHCSDNNKSDTVTQLFLEAVTSMGSPQGLGVTKELKTMEWDTSCYLTLNMVHDEEALFLEVSTIKGWRDFSMIYLWGA